MLPGYEYELSLPHREFRDINGYYNDSIKTKVSLPKDDKLSQLQFNLTGVKHRYLVELLSEKMDKVLDSYTVDTDGAVLFPYLKAGKYCVRLTQDKNRNGRVDTGNLLKHRQPEKVKFYTLRDGSNVINIPNRKSVV